MQQSFQSFNKLWKNDSTPRNVTVDGILSRRPTKVPFSRSFISAKSPFPPLLWLLNASVGLLMNFAPLSSLLCRHHNTCLHTCQSHPRQSAGKNHSFFYEKSRRPDKAPSRAGKRTHDKRKPPDPQPRTGRTFHTYFVPQQP